jgi:hypothetical protein
MKRITTILALYLLGGFASPGLSQEASEAMICSNFLESSADDQMEAITTAQLGEQAEPPQATSPDQETVDAIVVGCTENPDMMLGEVMTDVMGDAP